MFTDADLQAVAEFTRVAGAVYPHLQWEQLETEAGTHYLLVYQAKGEGLVSWCVDQLYASVGALKSCWGVYATHQNDCLLAVGETPTEALRAATGVLQNCLQLATCGNAWVAVVLNATPEVLVGFAL